MSHIELYDILILGSGEAGKYLAWAFATAGQRVAVVERGLIGGSCPNISCLPSKNVIHSAHVASLVRRGREFGIECGPIQVDMQRVRQRKRDMVDGLVALHLERFKASGAELLLGEGRFVAPKTIEVALKNGDVRTLAGDRVVIDVGSRAAIPVIPGLEQAKWLTHAEALELDYVPAHLFIIGGGYVGLEFAQMMRRLGSRVTIAQRGPHLAPREDPDVGDALYRLFFDEGINVLLDAEVLRVEGRSGEAASLHVQTPHGNSIVIASDILVAAGRLPNTHAIGLDAAGVDLDQRGLVRVNERLETSAPDTWAAGDCAGSPQFTHAGFDDFRVIRDNWNGIRRTTHERLVPSCLFTDPELGRVGLNETEARSAGIDYRVAQIPMAAVLRTRTQSEPRGFMKALVDVHNDRILGFTAFGAQAGDLIAVVQTAMLTGAPYMTLRDAIFTHPTMAEGFTVLFQKDPVRTPSG
jgi:pyruvate/2-oxoglutarate dehydrogenase complex dihydrolipoamide dehydrogenase (E3) component